MASSDTDRQKQLKRLLQRRHPEYDANVAHWEFLQHTYEGGREWFPNNIFRYQKEGDIEFKARVGRAYRFNHTREVVDLVGKYLFKMDIARKEDEAEEYIKAFWKNATRNGLGIQDYMKRVSNRASVFGRLWIVVDRTRADVEVKTVADEKAAGVREYSYFIPPTSMLDISYDELGVMNWCLVYEQARDDEDPLDSTGRLIDRFRLWTRVDSTLFEVKKEGNRIVIFENKPVVHDLGVVPVFAADDVISDEPYQSPAMIADVAYLDRACANYLSNLDAIIQDQTFSQLVIPAQALDDDAEKKLVEMGTKRIFSYNADGTGGKPEFISPDVKQAEIILKVVNKIINEIYHSVGLAGERTKEDNAMGIDNSSGVAKAYDFERVNSLLASKADSLEVIENKIIDLIRLYRGESRTKPKEKLVRYPENFDVRGLYDEFEIAARLALVDAPDGVRRKQMEAVIDKLFPKLSKTLIDSMKGELKSWPPKEILPAPGGGGVGVLKKTAQTDIAKKVAK